MSLIHQALKKIEFRRPGYTDFSLITPRKGPRSEALVLAFGFLAMLAGLAILAFYTYRLFDIKTEPIEAELKTLKSAIAAPPVRPGELALAHNKKGVELFRENRLDEARREFEAALTLDPDNAVYLNNIGLILLSKGDHGPAEDYFKAALVLRPGYAEALNNYGAVFEARGELKKAIERYSEALTSSPSYADAHLNMAIALEKSGDYRAALGHYEAYLGLSGPASADVGKKAARLRTAVLAGRGG